MNKPTIESILAGLGFTTEKAEYPWDDCLRDQMKRYGNAETARKVCGKIRAENKSAKEAIDYAAIEAELGIQMPAETGFVSALRSLWAEFFGGSVDEKDKKGAGDDVLSGEPATSEKAGARHSASDRSDVQAIHDLTVKQGAECQFSVKEVGGKHRWTLYSSSAYKDRDGEIVSTQAQEADIAALDKSGDYGVLRWWHVGDPVAADPVNWQSYTAGKGIDLGRCDFSAMHGRIRIESGTFYDEAVGARVKEVADQLTVSLGFSHPIAEPNREGVFEHIHTFERSLLPQGAQSNLFVDVPLILSEKERTMETKKIEALKSLLGDETAAHLLAGAEATQKSADRAGVKFKELEDDEPEGDRAEEQNEAQAVPDDDEITLSETDTVGELTMAQLKSVIGKCLQAWDAEKSAQSQKEFQATFKAAATRINELVDRVNSQGKRLKALEGDLPRSVKGGLRPSQADDNIRTDVTVKEQLNGHPLASFFDFAAGNPHQAVGGQPPARTQVG